ncbi:MAG: sodium:solute symporter family protein [Bacteroidales bacterium]|nr:sodium:solute symporter family protein [Bacteroidales bacterium]
MKLSVLDISLLIGYATICIGIGFWSSRGHKDEDYLIAGRKITLFGFISSVVASYVGGAAIVAYSAYVYQFGISAIAVFAGTAIGFLVFIPYALKLRKISDKKEFLTLSDWFYYKFDNKTGIVSAVILFVVYFGMLLNQFIAGSSILSHISGLSYEMALLISCAIISIYLVVGGFKSVIKTDIFQYAVLFVLFILLGYILVKDDEFFTLELVDVSRMDPLMTIVFIVFGILIIFQSAEYWQRVYAAKNKTVVKNGLIGSAIFVVITGFAITIVGLSAHLHVPDIESRNAFAEGLIFLVPGKYIGAGLILLFAAIMSSADTIIFVLASSLSKDYIAQFSKKEVNRKSIKKQTQVFIILFSILGFVFAYFFRDIVAVIIFITGIGFTLIPAAIASFHIKLDKRAALASFIGGIIYIFILFTTNNLIPELSIASILVATIILVSFQLFARINHAKT